MYRRDFIKTTGALAITGPVLDVRDGGPHPNERVDLCGIYCSGRGNCSNHTAYDVESSISSGRFDLQYRFISSSGGVPPFEIEQIHISQAAGSQYLHDVHVTGFSSAGDSVRIIGRCRAEVMSRQARNERFLNNALDLFRSLG